MRQPINRRRFLQNLAATTAAIPSLTAGDDAAGPLNPAGKPGGAPGLASVPAAEVDVEGHTLVSEFDWKQTHWKVYEDLRTRDGALVFVSAQHHKRVLAKSAELTSAEGLTPYLGLSTDEIAGTPTDLLARRILEKGGDPDPEIVRSAVPPFETPMPGSGKQDFWTNGTFIGTKECWDTQLLQYNGSTDTFISIQYCPEIMGVVAKKRVLDGLVGGWLPVIRKVFPLEDGSYWEIIGFPDVQRRERFIVHTWHRAVHVEGGRISKVFYRHTYRPYPPRRQDPKPEVFYRALLACAEYWEANLRECISANLPQQDWVDMAKHSFVKELMTRPGGVYPKYGVQGRPYAASGLDGSPITFTSAVYANLEWGRFETVKSFVENYFDEFVEPNGVLNHRGPETGLYGLILALLAKYYHYTRDHALLLKYRPKLQAIAALLIESHEASLRLPPDDPGHGLISGWCESDSCLYPDPARLWQPYFSNSAFAARGFRDLGRGWQEIARTVAVPGLEKEAHGLISRSNILQKDLIAGIERSIRKDMTPPYVASLPGMKYTFEEARQVDPWPQMYAPRVYAELLIADMLPPNLANLVIDCLLAYGGTTLGVLGWREVKAKDRFMMGFLPYGYAQTLLRLERVEEFLLFLYAHRYHCHARGHWTAAEFAGIVREPDMHASPYCTPTQQVVPLLIRWMLALEDSDEERLYLGRGIPRAWVISGKEIKIQQAPTRWGQVNFVIKAEPEVKRVVARVELARAGAPKEVQVKFRLPAENPLKTATVNGQAATFSGLHGDCVTIETGKERSFEIVANFA
jgi:hypothetical protein